MKRLIFLLVSVVFIYSSCDVIDDPIVPFTGEYNTELYGDPPVFTVTEQTGKNVLVGILQLINVVTAHLQLLSQKA